jgi:hypothetical protein
MRHWLPALMLASFWAGWNWPAGAQEVVPPPPARLEAFRRPPPARAIAYDPALTPYAAPFSRDPHLREQQTVARQLAVNHWTRGFGNAWALYVPDEYWLLGPPPLTWAWDFPPVEQPIGQRRIYDGRGGYSSVPIYADQIAPLPPQVVPVQPPAIEPPPAAEAVLGARDSQRPQLKAPVARVADVRRAAAQPPRAPEPRRLFSW